MAWSISTLFGSKDESNRSESQSTKDSTRTETSTHTSHAPSSSNGSTSDLVTEQGHNIRVVPRRICNTVESCTAHVRRLGWRGCSAMIAGFLQQSLCWGMIMTFGTIMEYYTQYLLPSTPKWQLTLVGSIPPFCLLSLALIWGRLLDAGHHRKLNIIAGIFVVAGLTGLAFTGGNGQKGDGTYWGVLLASIVMGIGQSIYFLSAPHMAKTWFPDNKGLAMGITNCGAASGGVVWPLVFDPLTVTVSFQAAVGTLAAIALIVGVFICWASVPTPDFTPRSVGEFCKVTNWVPTRALRSWTFRVHIAAMDCIYFGVLTIPFLMEVWAQINHLGIAEKHDANGNPVHFDGDSDMTFYIIVFMNLCQLPGRLLGSWFCDYVRARKIHAGACLFSVLQVALGWHLAKTYAGACGFSSSFGGLLGIMVSLPINDVQEILGKDRTHLLGQYAGFVYTCASPFILGGGILSGWLVDRFHIDNAAYLPCVAFGLGGILIVVNLIMKDDTWKFDEDALPQTDVEKAVPSRVDSEGFDKPDLHHRSNMREQLVYDATMQAHH